MVQTALITGGASGIGLGMARAFTQAGLQVVIGDVDEAAIVGAVAGLAAEGLHIHGQHLDVTKAASWKTALDRIEAAIGPVDLLCNNAGVGQGRFADGAPIGLADMPEGLWRLVMETNATGCFLGVQAAVPRMIAQGKGGHIVNTASMAGLIAPSGLGAYVASKYAIVGLSESLRAELASERIGVSVLCPGAVESNLVATSAVRLAATNAWTPPDAPAPASYLRMDATRVGERVLRAIADNEFYILTHPDYYPLFAERIAAIEAAFGKAGLPGYVEPALVLSRSRNPEYARATPAAKG